MRARSLAVAALVCSAVLYVAPSSAFDYASMARPVGANVVAASAAYNALTIVTCDGHSLTTTTCSTNLVTNKGTTDMAYRLTETADDEGKVSSYGIDGGSTVTNGATGWTARKSVSSSAAFNLHLVACGSLSGCASVKTYSTYWTLEGQKAGTANFTATRILITIQYP